MPSDPFAALGEYLTAQRGRQHSPSSSTIGQHTDHSACGEVNAARREDVKRTAGHGRPRPH